MGEARFALSLGTAERYGFFPVVLGYGHEATWAYGLSAMANLVRDYIFKRTEEDDIVLFFDAFDVVFQAGAAQIVEQYLDMESREQKELFYHAESTCSHKERQAEYPAIHSPWRFLNCGLYIGRSRAMRLLYEKPVPTPLVNKQGKKMRLQNWHTDYYLDHLDRVGLDSRCELMQVVLSVENLHINGAHLKDAMGPGGPGLFIKDNVLHNKITNTTPLILHFPGVGHWPDWRHPERVGTCTAYEVLRVLGHPMLTSLLEKNSDECVYRGDCFVHLQPWKALCGPTVTGFDAFAVRVSRLGDTVVWIAHSWGFATPIIVLMICSVPLLGVILALRRRSCGRSKQLSWGQGDGKDIEA